MTYRLPLILAFAFLTACGGGGGSKTIVYPSSSISYSGLATQASFDSDETAKEFSVEILSATNLVRFLFELLYLPVLLNSVRAETIPGPDGGSVVLRSEAGRAWLEFQNYQEAGITISGSYVQTDQVTQGDRVLEFVGLVIGAGDISIRINGRIDRAQTISTTSWYSSLLANLVIDDLGTGAQEMIENWLLTVTEGRESSDRWLAHNVTGRLFIDSLGYIDVQTDFPLRYKSYSSPMPYFGGNLLANDGASTIAVSALNQFHASVLWDQDNDGRFDLAARSLGVEGPEPDSVPPIVNIDGWDLAEIGDVITLSSIASRGAENELLEFEWEIIGRPAGSSTTLSNVNGVEVEFVPDTDGWYLISVRASDSKGVTYGAVRIGVGWAWGGSSGLSPDTPVYGQLGEEVLLDTGSIRSTPSKEMALRRYSRLEGPVGSNSILQNLSDTQQSFIPDTIGFYKVGLGNDYVVPVDTEFDYYPIASFIAENTSSGFALPGDFNGDGLVDIARLTGTGFNEDQYERYIEIYLATSPGLFASPQKYIVNVFRFAVGDLDNDGIDEIVGSVLDGIRILSYSPGDGMFIEGQLALDTSGYMHPCTVASLRYSVRDVDSDGLHDLTMFDHCQDRFVTWIQLSQGGLAAPVVANIPDAPNYYTRLAEGDLNGDGMLDYAFSNSDSVVVAERGVGHDFSTTPIADVFGSAREIDIFDIDFDGYEDVLIAWGDNFRVFPQQANGELGSEYSFDMPFGARTSTAGLVTGDFNNDGVVDMALNGWLGNNETVYALRNSDGSFTYVPDVNGFPFGFGTLVDVNEDGLSDIVSASYIQLGKPLPVVID